MITGFLFVGIAACFALLAKDLELGTSQNMGPGFFPLIVVGLIATLGLVIIVSALHKPGGNANAGATKPMMWRPFVCIIGSPVLFALLVEPFGLIPGLSLSVLFSTLGGRPWRPWHSIAVSALVTFSCWLVFVPGLGMPMPLFNWPGH